ncbi:hypothetical protein [Lentibacter sp.]|jgi:hypothetical protein
MRQKNTVFGHDLPAPKLTPLGAALLALAIALPCGAALSVMDWLLF